MALLVQHSIRTDDSERGRRRGARSGLCCPLPLVINWSVLLAFALLVVPISPAQAQAPTFKENAVKAVFLFNFAQFVEWPPQAFSAPQSPLVIGVLGQDPFGRLLYEAVNGEMVRGHTLVVERYRRVEEIKTCHILFISPSESEKYDDIFAKLQGRAILTVGDSEGFARRGGMIRFVTEEKRIRLRVNLAAARAAKLTISSKLLRQAEIVDAGRGQ
jgi:hypothetical protein